MIEDPPPPFGRSRHLIWPALALGGLMLAPPLLVAGVAIAALAGRVIWSDIRHVRERDAQIARRAERDAGLPLGRDSSGAPITIPDEALAAHGLILGATGAGKSTTLVTLMGEQIRRGQPVVAIDLKGSPGFARDLQSAAAAAGRSFVQWSPDGDAHWNPMANGNATELKDKLLATERFSEPHYRRAAERYLQLAIQVAHETSPGSEASLTQIVSLLSPERLAIAARQLPQARAEQLRDYIGSLTPDQHSAVRGLASRLAVLTESHIGPLLEPDAGRRTIDLREALNCEQVVLFSLNSSTYGSLAASLGTLVVQDLVAAAGARLSAAEPPMPAVVAIDEFSALGSENVLALLARGRESGVGVLLATQELADLDRAGRGLRDQVLGNTAVKIAHRQDVPESALTVAKLAGTVRVWERSYQERSGSRGAAAQRTTSARLTERYAIEPEQVRSLQTGDAVVIIKSPQASARVARVERQRLAPGQRPVSGQPPAPGVTR
jgi:type IV secretory pathway TraG/TraD family ATPase VirD4